MQDQLNIALIQADLVWENPTKNRENFTQKIESISSKKDLVVLPEMFTTGFTMNAKQFAEPMTGETVCWMQHLAKKTQAAIVGSLIILENNNFYNRLLFITPDGSIEYYNKRHSFSLVGENKVYTSGEKKLIITYKGWRICPLICYDLRFPVWARNTENYDVLLYVANWPKTRISAWDTLLKARAIENMCYSIGVNRVGTDGLKSEYPGHSAIYNVLGAEIAFCPNTKEGIEIVTLDKKHITAYRNKLNFLNDKDTFTIN